jgi:hypothetical protein
MSPLVWPDTIAFSLGTAWNSQSPAQFVFEAASLIDMPSPTVLAFRFELSEA